MNRREFLAASLAAAAVARAEEKPAMLPIVDTHQHLWDLKKFHLPWIKPGAPLARDFTPADYATATEGLNVVKAVYMEVDLVPEQQQAEADWVVELITSGKTPTVAAIVSGRPNEDGFRKYATQFKGSKLIKGIRRILHGESTPAGHCLSKEFIAGVRLLGELGLSFDLCMRPGELMDAVKLIDECPGTRFILDHCGNENVRAKDHAPWKRAMAEVAKRPNVVGKVSGIVVNAEPGKWTSDDLAPVVNHTLDVFGPDRVMFGGDWPVCTLAATYRQWVEALKQIVSNRPEADQKKMFHDNAMKFYGI